MQSEQGHELAAEMRRMAEAARAASRALARADSRTKDAALRGAAEAILARAPRILEANAQDVEAARKAGVAAAFLDRLALDPKRLEGVARAVLEVAALPDPVGEVTATWRRPNGLLVKKVRIPLGVILMIYEARPNVTIDAAALCLKSGNAVILRAGSEALRSATALGEAFGEGVAAGRAPRRRRAARPDPRPRGHLRAPEARRAHRPVHPARRSLAHPRGGGALARAGGEALRGRLPPLPRRRAPTRTRRWRWS